MALRGFFAYPGDHQVIGESVCRAAELVKAEGLDIQPWEEMPAIGFKIDDLIRDQIREVDILLADITYPNHNVFYEIGYAISCKKLVITTVNTSIERVVKNIQSIGLFDTIGWAPYDNSSDLHRVLSQWEGNSWTNKYFKRKNHAQPLFILDTLKKTEFRNSIFHAIDHALVNYRSFDPQEIPRLTAAEAISEVSASASIILPILSEDTVDSYLHNLRAAFLLGLAHGDHVETLAIQYDNGPAPLDYRDFITNSTYRHETEKHVGKFCSDTLIWNQRATSGERLAGAGILGELDLGSPMAENETQKLASYFVRTAEFSRALRAEGAVVAGRKGAGKTAVFLQVAELVSKDRSTCVVELQPASHNLSEMREALLDVVAAGVFDHTLYAFWQYIMYIEIILRIREIVLPKSRNDYDLQQRIMEIEESFGLDENRVSGDFTSRLEAAIHDVIEAAATVDDPADLRNKLTNLMFEQPIPRLREAVLSFGDYFDEIVVLLDDLDKGWPPRRVEAPDVLMVRHLIEVLNRIQRDLSKNRVSLRYLIFLRSDVYEGLVEQTSDRGKYNLIRVDWSDPEQLRNLLRQRVISSVEVERQEEAWQALNPQIRSDSDAVDAMIGASLRRPRFLIDLCERILSFAVNRGHGVVTSHDVDQGLRQMSLYLVSDFGYEMRDVAGMPEDIFYSFIGAPELLTPGEIEALIPQNIKGQEASNLIDLLLWYGFLGVVGPANEPVFIYDRSYDFRRLEAERGKKSDEALYVVNPAFILGLESQQS